MFIIFRPHPKRKGDEPLSSYSMFGSSMLAAFFDAIIGIGISVSGPTIRYVKTCKFRSGDYPYPADWHDNWPRAHRARLAAHGAARSRKPSPTKEQRQDKLNDGQAVRIDADFTEDVGGPKVK